MDQTFQDAQVQEALQRLLSAASDYSLVQYAQISSFTFFVWDYFVTLPNESRYFWSGQWTHARALFHLNRYQTMAWMIFNVAVAFLPYKSDKLYVCPFLPYDSYAQYHERRLWGRHLAEASACCVLFSVQLILACRVYGIYRRDRRIAALLTFLLAANLFSQIYILLRFANDTPREALPWKPGVYTCMGSYSQPKGIFLSIIPSLVFDVGVLTLVLVQGVLHVRVSERVGLRGLGFMRRIMKDSVLHFIVILLVYVAMELAWFKLPNVQVFYAYSFGIPIISVAGTRILISLKKQSDVSRRITKDSLYLSSPYTSG
ncbi:hypothetical protein ONZ45_g15691 [Pleurotus djamor]|nr:hypothetical protein ONZ45_g15691 [Pleurotus djamor]